MKKIIVAAFAALSVIHAAPVQNQIAVTSGTTASSGTTANIHPDNDEVVVTVTKNAISATKAGSAFSKIDSNEISRTQATDLDQLLNTTPGAVASNEGGLGSPSEVRLRGCGPSYSLILVDGLRVNTGINPDAGPFLTDADTGSLGNVEIVRGPQSTLYGSDSVGGVVSLQTKRGEGAPGGDLFSEAGSFNTFREGISSGGEIGKLAYFTSYERDDSQNDRPNNDVAMDHYALRLDYQALDNLSLRLTYRGQDGVYGQPGSIRPQDWDNNNPASKTSGNSNLVSLVVDWKVMDPWSQKLTLGGYFERSALVDPAYAGNYGDGNNTVMNAANYSADWQNVVQISRNNRITGGLALNDFTGDFYYSGIYDGTTEFNNKSAMDWATYLEDEWEVAKNLNLTGGLRYDHYQQAGSALTYRFTGAYLFDKTDTKIRASYGTAFIAPTLLQLFSPNPGYLGNQGLKPQTSQGWDIGADQYFLDRRVVLGATFFQNYIRDLINVVTTDPKTFAGEYQNIASATTEGVELSAQTTLFSNWKSRVSYTWTDSTVYSYTPQPRHLLSLDTSYLLFSKWQIGCGVSYWAGRVQSFYPGTVTLPNYATLRIYSRYQFNDHFALFARGENLTNTRYETTLGYPALPIGIYGGVELKF